MEEEIVLRAQGGDTDAFRMLVERYGPNAWRVARILLPQREQAEDALQEAWVDIWRGLPRFDVSTTTLPLAAHYRRQSLPHVSAPYVRADAVPRASVGREPARSS